MNRSDVLTAKFGKITKFNSQFSKTNVGIAYHGDNRNGSNLSKAMFEKMIPSLFGVPIVGEWIEENDDFGGHGGKIEITDSQVKYIDTTKPIGFVDSQAKVWWETVTEADGTQNEYLFTECFLWSSRYPVALKILEGNSNQSMEIEIKDGFMTEEGIFQVTDAEFSALCVLGSDVEPCFESSSFRQFNLDKGLFKQDFNLMVKGLKESLKEGGENMQKPNNENFGEPEVAEGIVEDVVKDVTEEVAVETVEETIEDAIEEPKEEEVIIEAEEEEPKTIDESTEETDGVVEVEESESTEATEEVESEVVETETAKTVEPEKFELSQCALRDKIHNTLNPKDSDGYRTYNYWIMDVFQSYVVVADENESNSYFKFDYTIGDEDVVSLSGQQRVFMSWLTQEEQDLVESEKAEAVSLISTYEALKVENEDLRKFKSEKDIEDRTMEVEEVFERYSLLLNESDFADLTETAMSMSIPELEKELSYKVVQKKYDFSKITKKDSTKIKIKNKEEVTPYGSASVYFNK